ncbi:hypothetical protein DFH07DRAFT_775722 [Mycena maculata]|uniref:Uncharacterized protein n=1 Tax=Mycena maculata TaxID=230809 RepID=A0AAD7IT69_9AGAR|nr:hypothetical protein DFH07DRAFT_775722 [Mycena maculata]
MIQWHVSTEKTPKGGLIAPAALEHGNMTPQISTCPREYQQFSLEQDPSFQSPEFQGKWQKQLMLWQEPLARSAWCCSAGSFCSRVAPIWKGHSNSFGLWHPPRLLHDACSGDRKLWGVTLEVVIEIHKGNKPRCLAQSFIQRCWAAEPDAWPDTVEVLRAIQRLHCRSLEFGSTRVRLTARSPRVFVPLRVRAQEADVRACCLGLGFSHGLSRTSRRLGRARTTMTIWDLVSVSNPEEVGDAGDSDGDVSSASHAMSRSSHGVSNSLHFAASTFSQAHAHSHSSNSNSVNSSSARSEEMDTKDDPVAPVTSLPGSRFDIPQPLTACRGVAEAMIHNLARSSCATFVCRAHRNTCESTSRCVCAARDGVAEFLGLAGGPLNTGTGQRLGSGRAVGNPQIGSGSSMDEQRIACGSSADEISVGSKFLVSVYNSALVETHAENPHFGSPDTGANVSVSGSVYLICRLSDYATYLPRFSLLKTMLPVYKFSSIFL